MVKSLEQNLRVDPFPDGLLLHFSSLYHTDRIFGIAGPEIATNQRCSTIKACINNNKILVHTCKELQGSYRQV